MRDLTAIYDRVYVDIDDTLVYGFWTDLMRHSWNVFRNDFISQTLMELQAKFKIYKVNRKLLRSLKDFSKVTFLTVRAPSVATVKMLIDITGLDIIFPDVVALKTDDGALEKAEYIANDCLENDYEKVCLIDDSKQNRTMAQLYGFDTIDPTGMYEKLCG